ncbi:MAG: fatty acyl-AMP ligase, partial [Deltaproteobacteria bacterium]|nr:fatty acyl-AMP ligase [Deltaproteobacteria bacterium]
MTRTIPGDIFSLLQQRADELPDRTIYRYLGETGGPSNLDYAQLLQASCGVAARLGPIRNERVLLLFPPGLEFITAFFGCAAAGAIAVPAPPPNPLRPKRSLQRLMTILQSAQPGWVLTVSAIHEALRPALAEMPAFAALSWVAVDELPSTAPAAAALGAPAPDDIAFIQYTSGSTSDPKGAAISHRSLVENIAYIDDGWDHGEDAVMVNWLPAFHDLGL